MIALFTLLIGAVALGWLVMRKREPSPTLISSPLAATTMPAAAPKSAPMAEAAPSSTILEVTPPATATTEASPALDLSTETVSQAPAPAVSETHATLPNVGLAETEPPPNPKETLAESPAAAEDTADDTYIARGDDDSNEQVLERLRQSLRGTRRIAVRGGDMQSDLVTQLQDEFPSIEITDAANVVIEFQGQTEELQRDRKTRAARATIRKNGKVIFRYVLQREMYRIGNGPVATFVGVLSEAFTE